MASPPHDLPQLDGSIFLMDGGLETTLTFLEGVDLPFFAAFPLLLDTAGRHRLETYFEPFIRTALEQKLGFILDTPTWRSNTDWGAKLDYSVEQLMDVNRRAVVWANALKSKFTMISPLKNFAAGSRQVSSLMLSIAGVRCESTSVLTPAS